MNSQPQLSVNLVDRREGGRDQKAPSAAETDFSSIEEVETLVRGFETGTLPGSRWDHRAHLAVAAWYLRNWLDPEATERMTSGIKAYNRANDIPVSKTGGYHETITLFWMIVGRVFLKTLRRDGDALEYVNRFVERFSNAKEFLFQYYDRDTLFTDLARRRWVPPNRYPIGELAHFSMALASR